MARIFRFWPGFWCSMTFTKDNPGLESVLEKARAHQWTPEERRAEMISFACGNVKLHNPAITKDDLADTGVVDRGLTV